MVNTCRLPATVISGVIQGLFPPDWTRHLHYNECNAHRNVDCCLSVKIFYLEWLPEKVNRMQCNNSSTGQLIAECLTLVQYVRVSFEVFTLTLKRHKSMLRDLYLNQLVTQFYMNHTIILLGAEKYDTKCEGPGTECYYTSEVMSQWYISSVIWRNG